MRYQLDSSKHLSTGPSLNRGTSTARTCPLEASNDCQFPLTLLQDPSFRQQRGVDGPPDQLPFSGAYRGKSVSGSRYTVHRSSSPAIRSRPRILLYQCCYFRSCHAFHFPEAIGLVFVRRDLNLPISFAFGVSVATDAPWT